MNRYFMLGWTGLLGFALDGVWVFRKTAGIHDNWNSPWNLFALAGLALIWIAIYRNRQSTKHVRTEL